METIDIADVILVREVSTSDLGLSYEREVLSEQMVGEREEKLFKTLRVYENKAEANRAKAIYEAARTRLRRLCSRTVLGLVCPASKEHGLHDEIAAIDGMIAEANAGFTRCKIDYTIVPIAIEHSNTRAQHALRSEICRYADRLLEAAQAHDPEEIRKVLRAGKGVETLVADETLRGGLDEMNRAARSAARELTRIVKEHDGDREAALASDPARQAAAEVARRFPWAAAFDVRGAEAAA